MKNIFKGMVLGLSLLAVAGVANAHDKDTHNKMMWMCETNASSASTDADKKADDMMKKPMKSAKAAFNFALEHCRDCTKVTCSTETK